jgi:phosphoribosylamine--glycine ligase
VDEFQKRGLLVFGPTRLATEVEASKIYSKELCRRNGIPTARARTAASAAEAREALAEIGYPAVLKADGLAAGKGVITVAGPDDAKRALDLFFEEKVFGVSGDRILVEEFLEGEEVSLLALCDGKTALALPTAKDYKKVFDGDRGPNTGGMGAHSPSAVLGADQAAQVLREIVHPAIAGMAQDGREFRGLLYTGLMLGPSGPKVLEFNARFGDPETEAILPRLDSDFAAALAACARGNLSEVELAWKPEACVAVVLASSGYPGAYQTGHPIEGIAAAEDIEGVTVFHAGTAVREGRVVTAGGRVLVVAGRGSTLADAARQAYAGVDEIHFAGKTCRRDIGARFSPN